MLAAGFGSSCLQIVMSGKTGWALEKFEDKRESQVLMNYKIMFKIILQERSGKKVWLYRNSKFWIHFFRHHRTIPVLFTFWPMKLIPQNHSNLETTKSVVQFLVTFKRTKSFHSSFKVLCFSKTCTKKPYYMMLSLLNRKFVNILPSTKITKLIKHATMSAIHNESLSGKLSNGKLSWVLNPIGTCRLLWFFDDFSDQLFDCLKSNEKLGSLFFFFEVCSFSRPFILDFMAIINMKSCDCLKKVLASWCSKFVTKKMQEFL